MRKKVLAAFAAAVLLVAIAVVAVLGNGTIYNKIEATGEASPTPNLTAQPTDSSMPTEAPSEMETPTPAPSNQDGLEPTAFAHMELRHTLDGWSMQGYLTKAGTDAGIPAATILLIDDATGEVCGQTKTLSVDDPLQGLGVGGFSFVFDSEAKPLVTAMFEGNDQYASCRSPPFPGE